VPRPDQLRLRASGAGPWSSTEGRILAVGLGLTALMLITLGIGWLTQPEWTLVFAAMTGLNLLIGPAAGMPFGYANGLDRAVVIGSNVLVETIQVLVLYPLFALSWRNLVDVRRLRRVLVGMRRSAEASRPRVARFGMVGLFVFVFLPFWMTGPVVGAIIGFLLGLKPRQNLAIVLTATYAAIGVWALLFEQLNDLLAAYGRYAAFVSMLGLAAAALAVHRFGRWRQTASRETDE
jgi:uncharacterized membrane protein